MIRALSPAAVAREGAAVVVEALAFCLAQRLWAAYARSAQAEAAMRH